MSDVENGNITPISEKVTRLVSSTAADFYDLLRQADIDPDLTTPRLFVPEEADENAPRPISPNLYEPPKIQRTIYIFDGSDYTQPLPFRRSKRRTEE